MSSSLTSAPPAPTSSACGGGGQGGGVFFAGRLSPMATTLESGYTVDSSGYVSYHSVPSTPFEPEMPCGGLMHPYILAPPVVYDEHAILEQLMAENATLPQFGLILDKDGTIAFATENIESFIGLSSNQVENQKIMRFVSLTDRQTICGLLPSANSGSARGGLAPRRKTMQLEFLFHNSDRKTAFEVTSQIIPAPNDPSPPPTGKKGKGGNSNNNNNATTRSKRPCVVCVARRTSSESSTSGAGTTSAVGCATGPAGHGTSVQRTSEPSLVLHLDRSTRRIVKADLRGVNIGMCESDFVSKKIDDLCRRSERTVIDALVGSAAKCSAELILCVKSHTITVDAITAPPTDPSEPIRLECVLLSYTVVDNASGQHSSVLYHNNNYCTSHSAAGIPVSSGSGSLEFEAISPPSLNSRDTTQQAPNPADTLSELCTGLFTGPADTSATFTTLECGSVVQLQPPQSAPPMAQPFRYPNAVAKQMPAPDLKSPGSAKTSHHSGETPASSPNASGFSSVLPPLRSQSTSSAEGLSTPSVQTSTFPSNASSTCTMVSLRPQQNAQLNFIEPPKAEPTPLVTPTSPTKKTRKPRKPKSPTPKEQSPAKGRAWKSKKKTATDADASAELPTPQASNSVSLWNGMSYMPSNGGFGSPEFSLQRPQLTSDAKDPTLKSLLQSPTGMSQQPPMQTFYYVTDVPYGSYAMPPTEATNPGSGMYNGFAGFPGQEQPEPKPPPKRQRKNAKSKASKSTASSSAPSTSTTSSVAVASGTLCHSANTSYAPGPCGPAMATSMFHPGGPMPMNGGGFHQNGNFMMSGANGFNGAAVNGMAMAPNGQGMHPQGMAQAFNPAMPSSSSGPSGCSFANTAAGPSSGFDANAPSTAQTTHASSAVAYGNATMMNQGPMAAGPMGAMPNGMNGMAPGTMNGHPHMMPNGYAPNGMMPAQWMNGPMPTAGAMYANGPNAMHMNAMYAQQGMSMAAANGMMNGANAGAKKNVLKRKNTQPNVAVPDNRPMKQPYMSPAQNGAMPNGAMYANATMQPSPMYAGQVPQVAMQNGNLNSPQFSSPSTPMSHLSPYGNYPDAAAAQQQYKRPSSRSEQIRMELRHTVHARQNATSPHPPGGVVPGSLMSPNEMGVPRFPGPHQNMGIASSMMSPPRSTPSNPSQQPAMQQQQQHPSAATPVNGNFNGSVPSPQQQQFRNTTPNIAPSPLGQQQQTPIESSQVVPSIYSGLASLEDCKNYLTSECDLSVDVSDFGLIDGRFDMSNDETLSLVQQLLS